MQKFTAPLREFFEGLNVLTDARHRRGVRFPVAAVVRLVVCGLLCGHGGPTAIEEFGKRHAARLWRGLGFRSRAMPHATTISRVLQGVMVEELSAAVMRWMAGLVARGPSVVLSASVDGKASRGSVKADGNPVMMLNVFLHDLRAAAASWEIGDKASETTALRARLASLCAAYPGLRILTGDALYANRPVCEALTAAGLLYVMRVKGNQPDLMEAMDTTFATIHKTRAPDATENEKKGAPKCFADCG